MQGHKNFPHRRNLAQCRGICDLIDQNAFSVGMAVCVSFHLVPPVLVRSFGWFRICWCRYRFRLWLSADASQYKAADTCADRRLYTEQQGFDLTRRRFPEGFKPRGIAAVDLFYHSRACIIRAAEFTVAQAASAEWSPAGQRQMPEPDFLPTACHVQGWKL